MMAANRQLPQASKILLPALVLAALAVRAYGLSQHSLWYDELLELDIAQGPFRDIGPQLVRHAAMPLDYYILHIWIGLGRQDFWVRLPALFFGVLAVPLVYQLGRSMFNRPVGLGAATLLTFSYFAVSYSRETRPYALLLFFATLTIWGVWQAHRTGKFKYWGAAIIGVVGAVLAHYFAVFLLAPLGFFVVGPVLRHPKKANAWRHLLLFGLVCMAVLLVFVLNGREWYLYSVGERFVREIGQPPLYTIPAAEKPNRGPGPALAVSFFTEKMLMPMATTESWGLLLYVGFFLVGVLMLLNRHLRQKAAVLLLLAWLLLPMGLIYLFLLHRGTFFAVRYILFLLPAFLLLAAYGLTSLANFGARWLPALIYPKILLSALLLLPLVAGQANLLQLYYQSESREDWRAVGQLLQNQAGPADAVIAVQAEPAINWYYPPARAPFNQYRRSAAIWHQLRTHRRRWFVLSSYSQKYDQGLRRWLAEQGAVKIAIDRRVEVYYHEEGKSAQELLADVTSFSLPQKPLTYLVLAEQLSRRGDVKTGLIFLQHARKLAAGLPASSNPQNFRVGG